MRGALVLAGTLALAGCATDRVTLLDNEPGNETGAVAVLAADGSETVLDQANSEAALRRGASRVRSISAVRTADTAVLASLPPAAKAFTIPFETNQSTIGDQQRAVLELIRSELSSRPGAQIEVAAFTDSVGSESDNYELSLDRARNVAGELRTYGFAIEDGDAIGRGEYEALKAAGDNRDLAEFRRVDVIVR